MNVALGQVVKACTEALEVESTQGLEFRRAWMAASKIFSLLDIKTRISADRKKSLEIGKERSSLGKEHSSHYCCPHLLSSRMIHALSRHGYPVMQDRVPHCRLGHQEAIVPTYMPLPPSAISIAPFCYQNLSGCFVRQLFCPQTCLESGWTRLIGPIL